MLGLRRLYLLNMGALLRRRRALAGDVQVGAYTVQSRGTLCPRRQTEPMLRSYATASVQARRHAACT